MSPKKDYILEVKSAQSNNIKTLFEVLKEVIMTDMNLIFTKDCIKAEEVTKTKKAAVHLYLESKAFESYHCEGKIVVGINTTNFHKITKQVKPDETVIFCIEKSKPETFIIQTENSKISKVKRSKLKILDIPIKFTDKIPPVEFDSIITIDAPQFQLDMKNLNALGDDCNVEITSVGQQIIFRSEGSFSTNETILGKSDNASFERSSKNIVQGVFPLTFLVLFTKATKLCKQVNLYFKNDCPLILQYTVGNLGSLKCLILPVVSHK